MTEPITNNSLAVPDVIPLDSAEDVDIFPTTLSQRRFWDLDRQDPGNPAYNLAVRFRLRGSLNHSAMERAFNEIVRRHESLRTVFAVREDRPVQVVAGQAHIALPVIDISDLPESRRADRAEELAQEEARRRFDITAGPLFRTVLIRLADQEHMLLITVHQMVSDCWSSGIITQELGPQYDACCQGTESPLKDLTLQYGDFAVWQAQWLASAALDAQLAYWKRQLAELPRLEIPTDFPRPPKKTSNSNILSVLLPKALTERVTRISHDRSCTFFMASLAALEILIQRNSGNNDVYVGTITAGRTRVEMEPLIGRFINPLIVRSNLSDMPRFVDLLARVQQTVIESLENREIPYECVVQALDPAPDPSRHPIFQINFVHQRAFLKPLEVSGLSFIPIPSRSAGAIYDLYFFMVERAEGWRFSCEYNTDLYRPETIERMLGHYQGILEGIAEDPEQRISELPNRSSVYESAATVNTVNGSGLKPLREVAPTEFEQPRTLTEIRLARLWERVTRRGAPSTNSNFFDEGGHSVLAAQLLLEIDREFGCKQSFAALFRAPTIRALARCIDEGVATSGSDQLYPIQASGTKPPLFLQTSQPHVWLPLARRLGGDQPLVGMMLPDLADLPTGFQVPDIAGNLVAALRRQYPSGPYFLGAWCLSGVVVYEMAQQLRAQGEKVGVLVLFDTSCPPYTRSLRSLSAIPARCYRFGRKLVFGAASAWQTRRIRASPPQRYGEVESGPTLDERLAASISEQLRTVDAYEPRPYDGRTVLFRSRVLPYSMYRSPDLGWRKYIGDALQVHQMADDHVNMFREPSAALLAARLAESLEGGH